MLCGPRKAVKKLVLDLLPQLLAEKAVVLVSMGRERFVNFIITRGRRLGSANRSGNVPQGGAGILRSGAMPAWQRKPISTVQGRWC